MVLAEKWAVDQETKLVTTGDEVLVLSGDNWSMEDMVKLRLGEVVLWLVEVGGEVPRVKLGREGLPGSEVEPVRSAWLLILLWRPSMTSLAMEATSVSGSRSRTIKLPNTRR